jgi:hypothetical protein
LLFFNAERIQWLNKNQATGFQYYEVIIQNMQKWTKKEKFPQNDPIKIVTYKNQSSGRSISISVYSDGEVALFYENYPGRLMRRIEQDKLLQEDIKTYKINILATSLALLKDKKNHENIRYFLNLIHQYDPLDEIRYEIESSLGLRHSEEEISKSLSDLTDAGDLVGAAQMAKDYQSKGYTGVVWALATSFQEAWVDPALIIDLCQSIPPHDPDFKEANGRLYGLCALKPGEAPTIPHLVQQLKYAFNSGLKKLIDYAYQALSDKDNQLTLKLKDLQWDGNVDTLVALGLDMREKNETIAMLCEENAKLKERVEALELQLAKLQPTFGLASGAFGMDTNPSIAYGASSTAYGGLFATSSAATAITTTTTMTTTTATTGITTSTAVANINPAPIVTLTTTHAGVSTVPTTTTARTTTASTVAMGDPSTVEATPTVGPLSKTH